MLGEFLNPFHRLIDSLRRDTARTLLMAAALGLVGWLVLYPLAILLLLGLHDKDGAWTLDNYRAVFTEPRLVGALANSVGRGKDFRRDGEPATADELHGHRLCIHV